MADAQASGACGSNIVWGQVPSPAYQTSADSAEVFSCCIGNSFGIPYTAIDVHLAEREIIRCKDTYLREEEKEITKFA